LREERRLGVFENRVLRIYRCKRDEVTGEWRKLHIEELNDLYCLPTIVQVIKSRSIRWAGHIACVGERRGVYRVLVGKPGERDHLEDPGVDWRMIGWIFRKWDGGAWTRLIWLRIGTGGGHL
jgi:hypothetical protein